MKKELDDISYLPQVDRGLPLIAAAICWAGGQT